MYRITRFGGSLIAGAILAASAQGQTAAMQTPRFAIERFQVDGNTLVPAAEIARGLTAFTGPSRDFADVQRAVETLEALYRERGYNTAYVSVPEQELEKGVVRLRVIEGRIGQVTVTGNEHFSAANIRAALPQLVEGEAPVAARLSENIQLANENPSKQVEVVLGVGAREGEVNANIKVQDERPYRFSATYDNTGTESTGQHRLGVSVQHNNLFDRDHSASFSYTMAPDKPEGVQVDIYSLGYRIPLYGLGDSIDLLYANSTVGVPSSSPSLGGSLGIVGKGDVFSLRYNWLQPRLGEYSSRVIFALDEKDMQSACKSAAGTPLTGTAGCEPYRVRTLAATYSGRLEQPGRVVAFAVGPALSIAHSSDHSYGLASGNRNAPTNFRVWRANGSLLQVLPEDWQLRLGGQLQWATSALVPTEQIGLAGSQAVRGFVERAVATDAGLFVQSEVYTPDLAGLTSAPGSLRALAFYDFANGRTHGAAAGGKNSRAALASAGLGLRYSYDKRFSWRFDLAHVIDSHTDAPNTNPIDNGWRGHFSLTVGF